MRKVCYLLGMLASLALAGESKIAAPEKSLRAAPAKTCWSIKPSARRAEAAMGVDARLQRLGQLDAKDPLLHASGHRLDIQPITLSTAEPVRIDLLAEGFDPMLAVLDDRGRVLSINDDHDGSLTRSRLERSFLPGREYLLAVTSYDKGARGEYELLIRPGVVEQAPRPRVRGVFVGVSEYDGADRLAYCAEDARRLRQRLIRLGMDPAESVLLTDKQATRANLRAAVQRLAEGARDDDLFVLFFSGHGGREAASAARPESRREDADSDGRDETIELIDGAMRDNELRALVDSVARGDRLVVLDSCFSGGFARDLAALPRCVGLYSSAEDAVSAVAEELGAGGYLAAIVLEALHIDAAGSLRADADLDGALSAGELIEFVRRRYPYRIAKPRTTAEILLRGRRNVQQFTYDRGAVEFDHPLLILQPAGPGRP